MKELNVNSELENIFPPLPSEVFEALEASIVKDGLLSPIVVWNNTIVDGHNRYKICRANNIEFDTVPVNFNDIEEAKLWIFEHQNGRRNLTDYSRCISALKVKPALSAKARERMLAGGNPMPTLAQGGAVRDEIAKIAGVSHGTLEKVEEIAAAASDEIKAKVQSGTMSIHAAHKTLKMPSDKPDISASKTEPEDFPNKKIIRFIELWKDINANLDILTDSQKERLIQVSEELIKAIQLENIDKEAVHE